MPRASMAKTVTLLVKEIPQDLSRVASVGLLCERFKTCSVFAGHACSVDVRFC